jgi:WD40 repeat protein
LCGDQLVIGSCRWRAASFVFFLAALSSARSAAPITDGLGDPLPPGAVLRLGTSRFRHGGQIYSLAYSADGRRVVTGNAPMNGALDASVIVWDAQSGQRLHTWAGHAHVVRTVAFSADNKQVVVVNGYGKVHRYDAVSGAELARLDTASPECALFTPDSTTLLVADGPTVRRWDLATLKQLEPLRGHRQRLHGLAVAGNGRVIATCAEDGTVRLWDAAGREQRCLTIPRKYGLGVALSPDGKGLACGTFEEEIHLWDTATGSERWHVKTDSFRVSSQAFSPDGKMLATGGDKLRLWDTASGRLLRTIDGSPGAMKLVAFAPDGKRIATAGEQATLHFWDPATGNEVLAFDGHHHAVQSGAFSPDGTVLATASGEPFVRLWDLSTGRARRFARGESYPHSVAFAPDGKTLATAAAPLTEWPGLWDLATGRLLRRVTPAADLPGGKIVFSADGKTLASSTGNCNIRFWDTATGRESFRPFEGMIDAAGSTIGQYVQFVLAPDGKTVVTTRSRGDDSGVVVWDVAAGKQRLRLANRGAPAAISADGQLVAVASDTDLRLFSVVTAQERWHVDHLAKHRCAAAFSPDGKTLATTADGGAVDLWETFSGQRRERLAGHQGPLHFVAFAPDGLRLASGGEDYTVLLWDLTGGAARRRLTAGEADALWAALGGEAAAAYRAIRTLASAPDQALPLLQDRLQPAPVIEAKRVNALLDDLDSDRFDVRQRGSEGLEELGHAALPLLRRALKEDQRSAEVRHRLGELLDKLDGALLPPPELRAVRAVEVLERIGSPEARRLLDRLAKGAEGVPRTEDARAAGRRLRR